MQGNRAGDTARTLILVGLILQVVEVVVLVAVGAFFLIVPFLGAVLLLLAFVGFLWVGLVYAYSYVRTNEGDYEGARIPTLVFAILSLVTVGLISGILYLLAFVKLEDAAAGARSYVPYGGAAAPLVSSPRRFCAACGAPNVSGDRFCNGCGSPL